MKSSIPIKSEQFKIKNYPARRDTKLLPFGQRPAGFTLVEIILAVALFGLFATALIGLLINSYGSNFQAEEKEKATLYAQQGLEAVGSIRRQAWNLLENGNFGLKYSSGYWEFSGQADLLENKYNRVIIISDVCRNVSGDIVDCSLPGAIIDLHSKKATAKVTYAAITGVNNEVELQAILTTWQTKDWIQTDWSGGSGQSIWSDVNRYFSDDGNIDYSTSGEVKLMGSGGGGGCGAKIWTFDIAADYTYNPAEIEVTGGVAQLIGSSSCSGTATACATYSDQTSCSSQAGCLWSGGGCSNNGVCGNITNKNACNACSGCTWNNPGKICQGTLNCPAQAVCTNCSICVSAGICSGTATACSTYGDQTSCENQAGCLWSGGYPTSSEIEPVNLYSTPNIQEYTSFSETATKNGGEIYYQLSLDQVNWYYWNSITGWTVTINQYSTANTINTNILSFPTTTGQITFKAFLTGDGSQQVQLDNVRIGWGEGLGAGYASFGWLESSAFVTGGPSAFNFLSWTEILPSANEDIKVQLATAPDILGSPGTWSAWMGLAGAGTYYQSSDEVLIPLNNGHNDSQWVKYKVILSGDGSDTPILQEIKINYLP